MAVLRESPWYQEILREGEQLGLQRERSLILKQLTRRVGGLSPDLSAQVQGLSIEQLETLGEALLDFTQVSDLGDWLSQNP